MLRPRFIPALLVRNRCLVKTVNFKKFTYIGDPSNTVRIFNELEVDELMLLDISPDRLIRGPDLELIEEFANEAFMPVSYGGGVRSINDAKNVLKRGVEKIVVNTAAEEKPDLITEIASQTGSQSIIVSIDVKTNIFGKQTVWTNGGRTSTKRDPIAWAKEIEKKGAGEILLTSINREGTWTGLDLILTKRITDVVNIPVIAHGGAGSIKHLQEAIKQTKVSAIALGSFVVFQKKNNGVLISYPNTSEIIKNCD